MPGVVEGWRHREVCVGTVARRKTNDERRKAVNMADQVLIDEHGKEVKSQIKKVIEPRPHPEDLTRVRTGDGPADYEYADPVTLFQLERLMPALQEARNSGVKKKEHEAGRPYSKACRDLAGRCLGYWPVGGYVQRGEQAQPVSDIPGAQVLQPDGTFAPVEGQGGAAMGDNVLPFPGTSAAPPAHPSQPEFVPVDGAVPVLGDPDLLPGDDPEVEQAHAIPVAPLAVALEP